MNDKVSIEYDVLFPQDPSKIFNQILLILDVIPTEHSDDDINILKDAFWDTVRLFKGQYPGYKACNTQYHDLNHSLTVSLSTARLLHGAIISGEKIRKEVYILGLIASLFHDVGLIQTVDDDVGTGAKYTIGHEERSINFMKKYLAKKRYYPSFIDFTSPIIACTMMNLDISKLHFKSDDVKIMGKIVGTADLYTQLADRLYLEKLLLLYREFKEGGVDTFANEFELLKNTESFYKDIAFKRFDTDLSGVYRFMRLHFREMWGIDEDYYMLGIKKNIEYLTNVVLKYQNNYRKMLRRAGIVTKLNNGF